jgi:hypothetical protein
MSDAAWVAIGAILMAIINTTGSVLILLIRAHYKWRNGGGGDQPPHGPPNPP